VLAVSEHDDDADNQGPAYMRLDMPRTVEPPDRERHRFWFAVILVILFSIEVLSPIVVVMVAPERIDSVLAVVNVVFTPTVAILGAVVGFYFGTKPRP
jgi:hypothetical protein